MQKSARFLFMIFRSLFDIEGMNERMKCLFVPRAKKHIRTDNEK